MQALVHPVLIGIASIVTTVLMVQYFARLSTVSEIPLNQFGSKTSYGAAALSNKLLEAGNDLQDRRDYKPSQVIGLFRHGIRYPGEEDIVRVGQVFGDLQKLRVSQSTLDKLQSAIDSIPLSRANQLASTGAMEHQELGQRFGRKFSKLFQTATENDISFLLSSSPRAKESGVNFNVGFQAALGHANISFPFDERKDLLQFFKMCPKYVSSVVDNKTSLTEAHNFISSVRERVLEQIALRLDLPQVNFTEKHLKSLYNFAAIEVALLGTKHWCSLLSPESIIALEFASDLKGFWKKGYGYPINYQISCPLLSDIFKHFDNNINGNEYKTGVFYFGHAETVVPVLAALGLFNDGFPLRAADFGNISTNNRKFRVSHISPFSTNIAFVLHEYQGGAVKDHGKGEALSSPEAERFMLELLFHETPMKFPFADRFLWPYSEVRRKYQEYIDKCSFREMCGFDDNLFPPSTQKK